MPVPSQTSAVPRHRLVRSVVAVTLGSLLVVSLASGGAAADPGGVPSAATVAKAKQTVVTVAQQVGVMQAQLALAEAKLQQLGLAVDTASEAYNGALYQLQQAQDAATRASSAADRAALNFATAQAEVGRMGAAAYRGGSSLGIEAIVTAQSPDQLLAATGSLDVLAARQAEVMDAMKASRVVADVLHGQATDALDAVTKAAEAARQAKLAVQARVQDQQSQVAALTAQRTQLTVALAAATAQSVQLTSARAAGLARIAAAKAAAARRARAAALHRHATGTGRSGSNSGNNAPGSGTGGHFTSAGAARAIDFAKAQLGEPYLWAATGPDQWDCSGLTMRAWEAGGISLPHWSVAQYEVSTPVARGDAQPGDLVFFGPVAGDIYSIHHVALYLGNNEMIEAPFTGSFVRISSVDSQPDLYGFARP